MGVRLANGALSVEAIQSPPATTAFTICGWLRVTSFRAGSYQAVCGYDDGGSWLYLYFDGSTLRVEGDAGGNNFASSPSAGDWIFFAFTCAGTGGTDAKGYWGGIASLSLVSASCGGVNIGTPWLNMGNSSWGEYLNADYAHIKIYGAALSEAELLQEMQRGTPARFANLFGWFPLWDTAYVDDDYSGNGKYLYDQGTVSNTDMPPVTFAPGDTYPQIATVVNQTVTLDSLALVAGLPDIDPTGGAVTVSLDSLALAAGLPDIDPTGGAVTVSLDSLALVAGLPDIDPTGGAVTVSLDSLTLAAGLPDIDPAGGAVTVSLDSLALAAGLPDIDPTGGAVTVSLDSLALAAGLPDIAAIINQSVPLDSLALAAGLPDIDPTGGAVTVSLDSLALAAGLPDIAAIINQSIPLDSLALVAGLPDIDPAGGAVTISLDSLALTAGLPDIAAVINQTILLDTLDLAAVVEDIDAVIGAVTISLDTLGLIAAVEDIDPSPGSVVVGLDTLSLSADLVDIQAAGGAVTVLLDTLNMAADVQDISALTYTAVLLDTLNLAAAVDNIGVGVSGVTVGLNTLSLIAGIPVLSVDSGGQEETHVGGGGGYPREHAPMRRPKRIEINVKRYVIDNLYEISGFDKIIIAEVLEGWLVSAVGSTSRILQVACAMEFPERCHLSDPLKRNKKRTAFESSSGYLRRSLIRDGFEDVWDAARYLARVIYAVTQDKLAEQKVEKITVYKPMRMTADDLSGISTEQQNGEKSIYIRTLPIASWSADRQIAQSVLMDNDILIMSDVPAENVFSMPITGIGSMLDREIVVMGGYPQKARVIW